MLRNTIIAALCVLVGGVSASAQSETTGALQWSRMHDVHYEVYAAINLGGVAPIPLPAEIRKIDGYNPTMNFVLGATATKWLGVDKKWGIAAGLRLENKGMKTKATVKNYGMEIIQDGSRLKGNWTGKVQTTYHSNQITIPITATYRISPRVSANLGPYVSFAVGKDFNGSVHDGYLREGDPTGNKVTFEGDSEATYDFGNDLRTFLWGAQLGMSWQAFKHLNVNANLTWGFNDIFKSSFHTVTFDMYPIYLNFGFGYAF